MDYKAISPEDPSAFPYKMYKFFIVTDDASVIFLVEDKLSEELLREQLKDLSEKDQEDIVELVKRYYEEDEIGQGKLSKVTKVAEIQRFLPS